MYLKKLKITHYRKFNEDDNEIEFVASKPIEKEKNDEIKIDIATSTTLIIGKNNAGKSTIINALEALINNCSFSCNDFNYSYLHSYFNGSSNINEGPYIEFVLTIELEPNSGDRITNLIPFMSIGDAYQNKIEIKAKYEVSEFAEFKRSIDGLSTKEKENFKSYMDIINDTKFQLNFYDKHNSPIDNFKLSSLIEIECIKANKLKNDHCLSDSFNRIVTYRYNQFFLTEKGNVIKNLNEINEKLSAAVKAEHNEVLTAVLSSIIQMNNISINLRADITFDKLMKDLITYEYIDNGSSIPESQFGLGYTNLVMIIASIINYIEKYPDTSFSSKINIITIEEPETYMHPQMQELFIKNIEEAIKVLMKEKSKDTNFQLLITSHSSHVLNSKIESDGGFDNICYLKEKILSNSVVNLCNSSVVPNMQNKAQNEFRFLKKHIKYKVSELFFCDAAVFVEGDAEATLLPYYIENKTRLGKYYISVFNVGGAHAYLYRNLIKELRVPVLLITDLDIKKSDDETKNISNIDDRITTNNNLIKLFDTEKIVEIVNKKKQIEDNMYVAFQTKTNEYYPTSFEESLILSNYDNIIMNDTLKSLKPGIYKNIVGENGKENLNQNILNSAKWQIKLADSKGDFASTLLFNIIASNNDNDIPELPEYIKEGFQWLENQLGAKQDAAE